MILTAAVTAFVTLLCGNVVRDLVSVRRGA